MDSALKRQSALEKSASLAFVPVGGGNTACAYGETESPD